MTHGFFAFLISFSFAQELAVMNSFGHYASEKQSPVMVPVSVLESDAAQKLFASFVKNKDIPFKYPVEGCYARAHEMAMMASKQNIVMGKVFAEGDLQAKTNLSKYPIIRWDWHVAPVAFVKDQSGETKLMVFDPSLFDKPVTVEEWKKSMLYKSKAFDNAIKKPKINRLYFGSAYQYQTAEVEVYKGTWDPDDLVRAKETFTKFGPYQDFKATDKSDSKKVWQPIENQNPSQNTNR